VDLGETSIDAITGGWTIAQRVKGHRHSTDDLLTGWYAAEYAPPGAKRLLDLGAGIGGVGLLALWRAVADATLVAVEAQEVSYALLVDNVARNALTDRVRTIHADLRTVHLEDRFDLITGSPPYWDVSQGVLPEDSQKAHARFELRGTVHDYALAAHEHLAPHGRFVFCFPTVQRDRALAACANAKLVVERYRDVIPRAGAAALFTLFAARRGTAASPIIEPDYIVRDAEGEVTPMHLAARQSFGLVR
jgi:tRNA1Val (adenine37-N6)-methyltransferase